MGQNTDKLQSDFESIYRIPGLFERQRKLVELFSEYSSLYQAEDFYRLFDAYCQQKFLNKLYKQAAQVFAILSSLSILFGVYLFIREATGRDLQLRREAWTIITSNKTDEAPDANSRLEASAGRKEALEDLNTPSFWWRLTHPFAQVGAKGDRTILSNIELSRIDLRLIKLPNANLQGSRFDGSDLKGANFSGANLAYSHFDNADLTEVDFQRANLEKADFSNASLADVQLADACLKRADLRGAYLSSNDLLTVMLEGVLVNGDSNINGEIDPQNLPNGMLYIGPGSDLSGADLHYQDLSEADLSEAVLVGADLEGADLARATLKGANIKGANFFKTTGLQAKQVLEAKNWQQAYYPERLANELKSRLKQGAKLPSPGDFPGASIDEKMKCPDTTK